MKILLFGATGFVGEGVLRWLITSPRVERVVAVYRTAPAIAVSGNVAIHDSLQN